MTEQQQPFPPDESPQDPMPGVDFGAAFRDLSAAQVGPVQDPRELAYRVVRRDQRRIKLLAALALVLWIAGAAGMLVLVFALNRFVVFLRITPGLPWNPPPPGVKPLDPDVAKDFMFWGTTLLHHATPWIAAAIVALMLAAVLTVALVFHSRRSTLNRINLTLTELSEQIKQLREPNPPAAK